MIRNEYFLTINIFALKGDLNGKMGSGAFLFLLGIYEHQIRRSASGAVSSQCLNVGV